MNTKNVKILGSGKYLPSKIVTSEELDEKLGLKNGWTEKKSGIKYRHYITTESSSEMGAYAIEAALKDANLTVEDIDCIVSTSGSMQQPIPCTAALIQKQLGWENTKIPCFDINSTCLSFVTGLDVMSCMIDSKRYKNIILVSTEVASNALNWNQKESCVLFGDGAVAFIIGQGIDTETSKVIGSHMETFSKGADLTEVRGGGTKIHPREHSIETKDNYLFHMDGHGVFKLSLKVIDSFMDEFLKNCNLTIKDIDMVVPHQASGMAMKIMRKHLGLPEEKFMNIIENHGNTIAASIPMALHEGIKQGKIKRGDKVMLIGTSAGLSIGGVVLEY